MTTQEAQPLESSHCRQLFYAVLQDPLVRENLALALWKSYVALKSKNQDLMVSEGPDGPLYEIPTLNSETQR